MNNLVLNIKYLFGCFNYLKCPLIMLALFLAIPKMSAQELLKSKKTPKIDYEWHSGRALMKSGLILNGKFKFNEPSGDIPFFTFEDSENIPGKKRIEVALFRELMLAGAEYGVTAYNDSTKFVWIDGFDNLYRVIRNGQIKIFDSSRIIDEDYEYLEDYRIVASLDNISYVQVKTVKDLEPLMKKRPYFMDSARATGKYNSNETRIFIFLADLYNDPSPTDVLQWKKIEITKTNGDRLSGMGYIQPLDIRGEHNTDNRAYVHLHDGKDLRLLRDDEIEKLVWNDKEMKKGYFGISDKHFYGIPWSYGGANYILTKRIYNDNNYFYYHKLEDGEDVEVLKEVSGTYIKPNNASILKLNYFQEKGYF